MAHPVVHKIIQGETLYFEIRLVGEDLTDATTRIETSAGMPKANFTATKSLPDTIQVKAVSTDLFAPGVHDLRVWLEWPAGDVREEVPLWSLVDVTEALNYWSTTTDTIDGGAPETEHVDEVEGGSP